MNGCCILGLFCYGVRRASGDEERTQQKSIRLIIIISNIDHNQCGIPEKCKPAVVGGQLNSPRSETGAMFISADFVFQIWTCRIADTK